MIEVFYQCRLLNGLPEGFEGLKHLSPSGPPVIPLLALSRSNIAAAAICFHDA